MSRLMHRTLRDQPDTAGSGEGTRLRLADGREVIDGSGGCAAALEVQRILRQDALVANVAAMGARLETLLEERFGNHRPVSSPGPIWPRSWTGWGRRWMRRWRGCEDAAAWDRAMVLRRAVTDGAPRSSPGSNSSGASSGDLRRTRRI